MDSSEIVKLYDAKVSGQQLLIPDDDFTLRNTPFKDTGNKQTNREIVVHWWMNVYEPNSYQYDTKTPYEIYRTWSNAANNNFHFAHANSGYNAYTNQSVVRLAARKKKKLDAQLFELNMWLPYIKQSKSQNPKESRLCSWVDIFEYTLSEHGSYSMEVFSETDVVIGVMRYHSWYEVKRLSSLREAVDYIRCNHYYE